MGDIALIKVLEGRPRLRTALKIAVPILVVLLATIYLGFSYVVASGVVKSSRKPLESDPSSRGLQYEDVEFSPREGDGTIRGWYLQSEEPDLTIILVHGINANREEGGDFLDLAAELVEEGFNVLLFDLRGHGASDGDQVSYGFYERHDVLGAFDFVVSRGAAPDSIGVLGRSLGAGTVLLAAAKEPRIQALVANSPYADSTDLIAKEIALKSPIPGVAGPDFHARHHAAGQRALRHRHRGSEAGGGRDEPRLSHPRDARHGRRTYPVRTRQACASGGPPGQPVLDNHRAGARKGVLDVPRRVRGAGGDVLQRAPIGRVAP